jgi:hypothetical protein
MRQNGHARHYDKLTPAERFKLDVLATARGDVEESELLTRTCQREIYTMNHRGFTGRWTGTYEITLRLYIALDNNLAKLQMVDAFRELVPSSQTLSHNIALGAYFTGHESGSRHAWRYANMEGSPPQWPSAKGPNGELMEPDEDEEDPAMEGDLEELEATVEKYGEFLPVLLDRLERQLATEALSLWEGFAAFCEESVGVPAENVVAVVLEPVADRIEDLKDRAERLALEAKPETVEEIREGLAESWRAVEKRGV